MKAEHFLIRPIAARANNLPVSFVAIRLKETKKAVWLYGHGAIDPYGHCARCGRTLTHPGSILIGIGPECLRDWGARDDRMENMTEADKKHLQSLITDRKVDNWIPKSWIKEFTPTEEVIDLPQGHKSQVSQEADTDRKGETSTAASATAVKPPVSKRAREWKGMIAIQFPYAAETVNQVKTLDGRKWYSEGKYWTAELKACSIMKLREWGFELDESLAKHVVENLNEVKRHTAPELDDDDPSNGEVIEALSESIGIALTKSGIKRELFQFQKEGVAFIHSRKGRALIGSEMGLGKTIQALAYLQLHPELRPAIVVCPASLKLNWVKEIQLTMTEKKDTQILTGKTPSRISGDIVIINYDILKHWVESLLKIKPKIIIADEIHFIKSNSAKRTKAMKDLAKPVPHFIALSGTPIVNRPIEIYNAVTIVNPRVLPKFIDFAKRYCGAVHNGFGWEMKGATNSEELHKLLTSTVMIRHKKSDVLKDLPDKTRSFVPIVLDNQEEYTSIEDDVIGYLKEVKGDDAADRASNAEIIVRIEQLKQAAARGKLESAIEWIDNFLESGEKLVVFATHKFVIDRLIEAFKKVAVKIDGSTSMVDRDKAVVRFQTDPSCLLMVGNTKAAGVGYTFTAASNVAVLELPWTSGDLVQAEDRCHRIGQKDAVNVYLLLAQGTIDEKIAYMLDSKTKVLDAVLDGKETQEESLLKALINSYK